MKTKQTEFTNVKVRKIDKKKLKKMAQKQGKLMYAVFGELLNNK